MAQGKKNTAAVAETAAPVVQATTYTIEEFAAAPDAVGAKSPDIVRAALKAQGKASFTIGEAEDIVKKFAKKEVK